MTTGAKIASLRKAKNLTQEQLAEMMNVSRQSISKWESDGAWPETDKLIALSNLFECSLDYLLKDEVNEKMQDGQQSVQKDNTIQISFQSGRLRFEYVSKKKLWGLPLVHVTFGNKKVAKGVIAIGVRAKGIISFGVLSMGIVSMGVCSLGLLAFGVFVLGLLSFGAVAAGIIAFGAVAFGIVSVGACSIGLFSCGAYANGHFVAIGDTAVGQIGIGKTHTNAQIAINQYWGTGTYKLYGSNGEGVVIDRDTVCSIIDQEIPQGWNFFKNIIKVFLV